MEGSSSSHFLAALLIVLAFTSYISPCSAISAASVKSSTEFIKTSCDTTTYPKLCYTSLLSHATVIQTSPKLLAHTALSVTLDTARSTSTMIVRLSQSHGMKPREVATMRDCVEELSDSVDQLRKSIGEMSQFESSNSGLVINNIQTWVSAALTDENTCIDGFSGEVTTGNLKVVVRGRIMNIAHLTSNALALIKSYSNSLHFHG